MDLDRNQTSYQRLNNRLLALFERNDADRLTHVLHEYVISERRDAVRSYVEQSRAKES